MKVYIMCDQEGTAGMVLFENRDDNDAWNAWYRRRIMKLQTAEVKAAVEGLLAAGATDIVINDAHGSGYNILFEELEGPVRVIHGNQRHAEFWLSRLDDTFDAGCYLGGHPMHGTADGILPHTHWDINGIELGEVGMAMTLFGYFGVPPVFVSGAAAVRREVQALSPDTELAVVKEALAPDIAIEHIPANARRMIYEGAKRGLERVADITPTRIEPPYDLLLGDSIERTGDDYYEGGFSALTEYYHSGRSCKRDGREWGLADE